MTREIPPKTDEFEISIIGPGRGECVILHLGQNEWCVIDSCAGPGDSESAAIGYLSAFGPSALEGVRLVVATHWHDDHIRGIASALERFPNASFSCSIAVSTAQFVELVELTSLALPTDSGLDEFRKIFSILETRAEQRRGRNLVAPSFAIQRREILSLNRENPGSNVRIVALSPSDATHREALRHISTLIPKPGQTQRRVTDTGSNNTSVVLWVTVGSQTALLGADLEHSSRIEEGWFAVINAHHGRDKARYFKIPHHGSANADCPEVWKQMLQADPVAVVTPFTSGKGLPQQSDLDRLSNRTPNLYCTSTGRKRPPRRDPLVEKRLRGMSRYVVDGQLGHVRIRCPMGDNSEPSIDLFNGAFKV